MKRIFLPIATASLCTLFLAPAGRAQDAASMTKKGIADYKAGKLDDAIKDFDDAIKLDPKDAGNFRNRGIVYGKKKDYPKAIESYTGALKLNPKDVPSHQGRGGARVETRTSREPSKT